MAQLAALVVTQRRGIPPRLRPPPAIGRRARSASSRTVAGRSTSPPDLVIVDIRGDAGRRHGGHRAAARRAIPTLAIFAVAQTTDPELILQAMRAGANEFFMWPVPEDSFQGAVRRTAARRDSSHSAGAQPSQTLVFFGAKGGAGTTTVAVNCAVELARLTKRPTLIRRSEAVLRRGRALPRRAPPLHGARRASTTCTGSIATSSASSCAKHKSGLEILAGSEQFERPSAAGRRRHRGAVPRARQAPTTTSSSMPATRSTRAASPRCMPPTRSSSS